MRETYVRAAQLIRDAKAVLITAGAGMGVDSGLPDFRGHEGFWRSHPTIKNMLFSELADETLFDVSADTAWQFYGTRQQLYKNTQPHLGFYYLLNWLTQLNKPYFVYTSNVDGHFQKAGFNPQLIFECHGNINRWQCSKLCTSRLVDASLEEKQTIPPICNICGAVLRPNILMFNDRHFNYQSIYQQKPHYRQWLFQHESEKLLTIEIGAGTHIPTVRRQAEVSQGDLIRINPNEAMISTNRFGHNLPIPVPALEALTSINKVIKCP